ncbi:ribonuclease H2 subunit C [Senna tora]|uniref:Ribonuclease H2 subunit C n=1 Tax=Senna tora TaxID=362788 RepID=A0A834XDR0_9FABA|nr:ribonuclease H2 subunit C [Senna tora]
MEKGTPITIDLKRDGVQDLSGHVHQLPCCVKSTAPASVSHYFKPKSTGIEVEGLPLEEAYFRGRKLDGATIGLPDGYCGFVLGKKSLGRKKSSDISEDNSNSWEMKATFQKVTYWNHDCLPSQNDDFLRAFHWLTVAKALHNPVTPEDLASTSFAL